jgi:hypothetical protein
MTINLADFLNKEVTVTLRNGEIRTGIIANSSSVLTSWLSEKYPFYMVISSPDVCFTWTSSGLWSVYHSSDFDILKITPKQMNTRQQLLQTIQETEEQLNKLKEQQKPPTIQEAKVGDTLEDGSIVIKKENGLALVIAPRSTQVYKVVWTKEFPEVYSRLAECGFIPSQWFIPTIEQLQLAYRVIPDVFINAYFWSSNETSEHGAKSIAAKPAGADVCYNHKRTPSTVRAFRCISY